MTMTFNTQTRPINWAKPQVSSADARATGLFLEGFDAATAILQETRRTRSLPALGWHGALGAMLLEWRTAHAHLSYADQTAALAQLRRGWLAAEKLNRM